MVINVSYKKIILIPSLLWVLSAFESCKNKSDYFMQNIKLSIEKKNDSDYTQALIYVNDALKFDSTKSFAYVLKGQIEACLEQDPIAIKSYEKALHLNPKNVSAYFFKGLSYYVLDFNDSAISCFTNAINAKKTSTGIIFDENNEHLPLQDQLNVPNFKIFYFQGLSYFYNNQFSLAIEDLSYSLISGYQVARSQFYIGASYLKMGNRNMACFYLKKASVNGEIEAKEMLKTYCH